jgi:hypothetical protein
MSWKVSVFASMDDLKLSNAAVVGVCVRNKKGIPLENGCVSFRRGTVEPDGATAMVDIESSSNRVLDQKAKKLSLVVQDIDTGVNHFIPTDGEYDVEEVF